MEKFLGHLREILDSENSFAMDTYLSDIEEWDSLSVISFAAMTDIQYGKKLKVTDIRKAEIVQDLFDLVAGE